MTETVLLTPLLVVLVLFVVLCGRLGSTANDVETAASDAARAASIELSSAAAVAAGESTAAAVLAERSVGCSSRAVVVSTGGLVNGGTVEVTVTCVVSLADLSGLGLPGSKTVTASAAEIVDRYRGAP
ncbi:MAG TPA: TadE/TadG family type IV pilus assembly protein [Acidimicrobiales bacterium]